MNDPVLRYRKRMSLSYSWLNMALASWMISLVGAGFTADCIWLAAGTQVAVSKPLALEVESVTSLYVFSVFGTIAVLFILHCSLQVDPQRAPTFSLSSSGNSQRPGGPAHLNGISVDIVVRAEVEEEPATFELMLKESDVGFRVPEKVRSGGGGDTVRWSKEEGPVATEVV